ncbi:MAG: Arc family DNA-binding protein [bacterium]
MGKDTTYTLRLSSELKKAIKIAAKKDHRSVASLLEKIVIDYLQKERIEIDSMTADEPDLTQKSN